MDLADLTRDLEALRADALASIEAAPDTAALEAIELDVLGKTGRLTSVLRGIGGLPGEDRPKVGAVANAVRGAIEGALADRTRELRAGSGRPLSCAASFASRADVVLDFSRARAVARVPARGSASRPGRYRASRRSGAR